MKTINLTVKGVIAALSALALLIVVPLIRSANGAGSTAMASKLEQKFTLRTGHPIDIPFGIPVFNRPIKVLAATSRTLLPTFCHDTLQVSAAGGEGILIRDSNPGDAIPTAPDALISGTLIPGTLTVVSALVTPSKNGIYLGKFFVTISDSTDVPGTIHIEARGLVSNNEDCPISPGVFSYNAVDDVPVDLALTFIW